MAYLRQDGPRVAGADFKVFRRDTVGKGHRHVHIRRDHHSPPVHEGAGGYLGAGQTHALPVQLLLDIFCQWGIVGNTDGRSQGVVLCLREHVCGYPGGVGTGISQDQDLARPGDHVDAHLALHQSLGCGNKDITRPCNDIHGGQ